MSSEPDIIFNIEDKTYKISQLTQEVQDAYGRWCENQSFQVLRHSRTEMDDNEYYYLLSQHQSHKKFGAFELLPNTEATRYLGTADGYAHLMFLLFRKSQGITEDQIKGLIYRNPERFAELFNEVYASKKKSIENVDGT